MDLATIKRGVLLIGRILYSTSEREQNYRVAECGKTLDVRNGGLDRVVEYLQTHGLDSLWIDEVCIDQDNTAVMAKAINSMDLVYKRARRSVCLLSYQISSSSAAKLLGILLDGQIASRVGRGCFLFERSVR